MTNQVRNSYRHHRKATWGLATVLVVTIAAVAIPIASGAADKIYTLSVPQSAVCSSTNEGDASTIVTIRNRAKSASLGSAEIYFPAGKVSTSISTDPEFSPPRPGSSIGLFPERTTIHGRRDVVVVQNLSLAKDSALGILVRFKASATFGSTDIKAVVKQSNNFNDSSGTANLFEEPVSWPSLTLSDCVTISGTVWNDQDQNGSFASTEPTEPKLGGWTVRAYSAGPPRQLVATATSSQVVADRGTYSLTVPANASYVLCETSPSGTWGQTTPGSGTSCSATYASLTEEPNGIAVANVTSNVPNQHFGNVPTVMVECGETTTGTYSVELGTGSNCAKTTAGEFAFDTWKIGNQTYFKFVPIGGGAGGMLLAEKLVTSYSPNPAAASPQATLVYDDNLSGGFSGVEMPYCEFDPRTSDPDKTTIAQRDTTKYPLLQDYAEAVLPGDDTSCLLEATQKIRGPQTAGGQSPLDVTFYVFSAVDGGRRIG